MPYGPMHAGAVDVHAGSLAPKSLWLGRPADLSGPAHLSSNWLTHARSRLMGVWPGRPADYSGPAVLILLLQCSTVHSTSITELLYTASGASTK